MKKLLIITTALILSASALAYAMTDYTCVNACTAKGFSWGYCKSVCSY